MANVDAETTFAVNLEDGTSGPAEDAAEALLKLKSSIEGDTRALSSMQRALKNLQGGTVVNVKQFKALQQSIGEKKSAIAQAQSSYIALGGSFTKTGGSSKALETKFQQMLKQIQGAPGPLGQLAQQFGKVQNALGGGKLGLAVLGLGAALTYLVIKTGETIHKLYEYGVAQADARRSEMLRFEGLTKMRFLFGAAAGKASDLQNAVDQVSASTAISREKVSQYAEQLYKMQLRGQNLQDALEGVAIKSSVQGDAAAQSFAGWAAGANMTGQSVRKLSDDVKARLGGIAQRQMLSATVQAEKMHEATASLFSGLKIEEYLKGQGAVNDLLKQSTNSGKALKAMLTTLLQPIIDRVTAFQPVIKRFWQGMIIGALHVGIAVLQLRNWFRRTFGDKEILHGFDATRLALMAGKAAVGALAGALAFAAFSAAGLVVKLAVWLVPAIWSMVSSLGALAAEGVVLAAPFLLAAAAIWAVINTGRLLLQLWKEIDFKLLGQYMWQGIRDGFESGKKFVVDAVKSLGHDSWKAFKDAMGISSPSKVFMRLGLALPAGVAMGVRSGAPLASAAVADMSRGVAPRNLGLPSPEQGQTAIPGKLGGQQKTSIVVGDIHIHASSDKPRDMAADFRRELERALEQALWELGLGPITTGG